MSLAFQCPFNRTGPDQKRVACLERGGRLALILHAHGALQDIEHDLAGVVMHGNMRAGFTMAETVGSKPMFREGFKCRHCLVPVETYYEWQKLDAKIKQPAPSRSPAGASWRRPGCGKPGYRRPKNWFAA